ncbi:MAG: putative toxin-antitoxin system toxin component, PIN family [Candidatus Sumerlaeota bacterium]|nr:putative toxin-antitoxin system toxin component, PIN family [Candidatus Sumerlaeota bacterium]
MDVPRVVVDSNVLVAGLRSRRGASFRLLSLMGAGRFVTVVTVPLVVEYEMALGDREHGLPYDREEIRRFLDYFCAISDRRKVHFLWRPSLRDANDDMVLEAAVAGGCKRIVTFNTKDFAGVERFGIRAVPPGEFLRELRSGK